MLNSEIMKRLMIFALFVIVYNCNAQSTKKGPTLNEMVGGKDYVIKKVNDSLWSFEHEGVFKGYGTPVDETILLANLNNRTRNAAGCFIASGLFIAGAGIIEGVNLFVDKQSTPIHYVAGLMVVSSLVFEIAGVATLSNDKVYVTPEGVIIKLNQPRRSTIVQRR